MKIDSDITMSACLCIGVFIFVLSGFTEIPYIMVGIGF